MSHIWMQSRFGRRVDMLDPTPEGINWWEICKTLANIQRYNGCADPGVSVAFHSLFVCDLADASVKPYALLHDFHEAIIGDITTPTAHALAMIAEEKFPHGGASFVSNVIKSLKRRHDLAIWAAAGLAPPTPEQSALIREADIRALVTEVRDFMRKPPDSWGEPYASAEPAERRYTGYEYGGVHGVAHSLYLAVVETLPALKNVAVAADLAPAA